jgi:hypothetical protein
MTQHYYELEKYTTQTESNRNAAVLLINYEKYVVVKCRPIGNNLVDVSYLSRSEISPNIKEQLGIKKEDVCKDCQKKLRPTTSNVPWFINKMVLKCGCGMRFNRKTQN